MPNISSVQDWDNGPVQATSTVFIIGNPPVGPRISLV